MDTENTQNNEAPAVSGDLTDEIVQRRLQAVANAASKNRKSIKSRHTVEVTEVVKVATAFGATTQEVTVEKEVQSEPKTADEKKVLLEAELDHQLKQKLGHFAVPVEQERLDKAAEIRDALSGLWSTDASTTSNDDDAYIEGVDSGEAGATRNPNSGKDGVRITFRQPKR